MPGVNVKSEIGPLKRVLLHRPGEELLNLTPNTLEELLFDDIPYLETARAEHDRMAAILREQGAEVVYVEDLMADVLRGAAARRARFIRQLIDEGGPAAQRYREPLTEYLGSLSDERELVRKAMAGVSIWEIRRDQRSPLADLLQPENRFLLDPIPNLYFTRDPFSVIGRGVSLYHMYSVTRRRETIFGEYILRFHPDMQTDGRVYYRREDPFCIEGGDILNLSERVVAVGISQRTSPEGAELLAQNLFRDETCPVDTVLALVIPGIRAFMHRDTVFTQVDRDKFLVHPGILPTLRVFRLTPGTASAPIRAEELHGPLERILGEALGLGTAAVIRCGGSDRITSDREQWNDGSNAFCVRPGTVVMYDRNRVTNEILAKQGIEVLEMPSSELSRGRGGPRCMTLALEREEL